MDHLDHLDQYQSKAARLPVANTNKSRLTSVYNYNFPGSDSNSDQVDTLKISQSNSDQVDTLKISQSNSDQVDTQISTQSNSSVGRKLTH